VRSALGPEAFVECAARLSRQGKLPGFARLTPEKSGEAAFRVLAFGGVFDHEVVARVRPAEGGGSEASFTLRALKKVPAIMIAVLVLSVWPGLPLTDSMLRLYFDWYAQSGVQTWWWYLPCVLLALPPLWKQWKRAGVEAVEDARKQIAKVEGVARSKEGKKALE